MANGYVITTTPGLLSEGTWAIPADAIRRGEVEQGTLDPGQPIAVYRTQEAAEAAMHKLVPDGSTPGVYAGLSVEAAGPYVEHYAYPDVMEWMD